ncbi:hypothetical protein SBDP1_360040 [Syntrophobacter sp. SbD1]|nr:hypothetical protein SBDP1_360040 [Syntrophobacter sp. SbD1]
MQYTMLYFIRKMYNVQLTICTSEARIWILRKRYSPKYLQKAGLLFLPRFANATI